MKTSIRHGKSNGLASRRAMECMAMGMIGDGAGVRRACAPRGTLGPRAKLVANDGSTVCTTARANALARCR